MTLVLRFSDLHESMASGTLRASIEVHDAVTAPVVEIDDQEVPLETDYSAALAYRLEGIAALGFRICGLPAQ